MLAFKLGWFDLRSCHGDIVTKLKHIFRILSECGSCFRWILIFVLKIKYLHWQQPSFPIDIMYANDISNDVEGFNNLITSAMIRNIILILTAGTGLKKMKKHVERGSDVEDNLINHRSIIDAVSQYILALY